MAVVTGARGAGPSTRNRVDVRRRRLTQVLLVGPLLAITIGFVVPVMIVLVTSIHGPESADPGAPNIWFGPFIHFFDVPVYYRTLWTTIRLSVIVTILCILFGYPTAYYIASRPSRVQALLMFAVASPLLISMVIRTFGWILLLSPAGIISWIAQRLGLADGPLSIMGTELAAVVGLVHLFLPYQIVAVLMVIRGLDPDVKKAAAGVGGTPWFVFSRITFPLSLPGVYAGSSIVFALSMSSFVTPQLLGGSNVQMTALLAYNQVVNSTDGRFAGAITVVLIVVTFLLMGAYAAAMHRGPAKHIFALDRSRS